MKTSSQKYPDGERRGVILIAAMICLLIIGLISVGATRSLIHQYRYAQKMEQRDQAYWLAASAMDRARVRLQDDRSYRGETWKIAADDLAGAGGAVVIIKVNKAGEDAERFEVLVEAAYPDHAERRILIAKQHEIRLVPTGDRS